MFSITHSSGVLLGLPILLHFFRSLGMVIASLRLMWACVERSFSQVVLGLPVGLVSCMRTDNGNDNEPSRKLAGFSSYK